MALPAITPRGMLHPKGRHRPRTHVAGNAIASHLKLMGNGRRRPGQFGSAQTGRHNAHPIAVRKHFGRGHRDVTLPAGDLLRMGRYGCISSQFFRPAAPGMTGQTIDGGKIGFLDFMGNIGR